MTMISVVTTPFGNLKLTAHADVLVGCVFTNEVQTAHTHSPVLKTTSQQLKAYFQGKLKQFDVPLMPEGTDFQKNVWDALLQIPYGETRSYQDIAKNIDRDKAARAVGTANSKNPLCIFIPCHRVIQTTGNIGGYTGGQSYKIKLLTLESAI